MYILVSIILSGHPPPLLVSLDHVFYTFITINLLSNSLKLKPFDFLSDYCISSPCGNGGTCLSRDDSGYLCKCTSLFRGIHCESTSIPPGYYFLNHISYFNMHSYKNC